MSTFAELFHKTDWELFSKQKQALIASIQILADEHLEEAENLEGLLNWIDYVQDMLAENLSDKEVSTLFNFKD